MNQKASARFSTIRKLVLPAMLAALLAYGFFHSPLWRAACDFCSLHWPPEGLLSSLSALWLALAASGAAWICAAQFHGMRYEKPLVFGLSAFAFIAIPAAWTGELADLAHGAFLRPPLGPLLASLPAAVWIAYHLASGWRPRPIHLDLGKPGPLAIIIAALSALVLGAAIVIGMTHPATSGDALSYHGNLAVYLWRDGSLGAFLNRAPDIWALAHPGMAELWFGLLRVLAGEWLANLGQLPFTLLGMAAIAAFARRSGLSKGSALLAGLTFALIPIVALQSVMQPNDVVGAALFITTAAFAVAPVAEWNVGRLALVGIGLGLLATTKLALLPLVFATGLFCLGALLLHARSTRTACAAWGAMGLLLAVSLATAAPWWLRNVIHYGNPIFPSALPLIGRGIFLHDLGVIDSAFVPTRLAWPVYPLIEAYDDRSGFGALFLVAAVPGLVVALFRAKRRPLALFLLNVLIMLPAWWIFTLHEPRFFLGLVGLSAAFIPWIFAAVPRQRRVVAGVLLALAACFSALVIFDQGLLPFARQPNNRAEFYDRVWAVDPYVTGLPENEGILLHTGFAPKIFEYTAFYPLLGADQSRLVLPIDGEKSPEAIAALMRRYGVRYAYVAASPGSIETVQALYPLSLFEPVHQSAVIVGEQISMRRYLYRDASPEESTQATIRYLFRLK